MIDIGLVAKELRESLGWTQRRLADALGVTDVHICNIENGKSQPSQSLLDKYQDLWGIDLYVLAWCQQGNLESLPPNARQAAATLTAAWNRQIRAMIKESQNEESPRCSISAK